MAKTWQVVGGDLRTVNSLTEVKSLLLARLGMVGDEVLHFFEPDYVGAIHSPGDLYQMELAVERIYKAVKKGEQIIVYGDYDADGVTSSAILMTVLEMIGAKASPFLPHRMDHGYGLNLALCKQLAKEADVIMTVDCGVANIEEIAWLQKYKVDVIVVDHHSMKETLPVAHAVLHPRHPDGHYGYGYLCGAGMAWKLAQALLRDKRAPKNLKGDEEKWLLDLAMLGTVADIVPLLGENRTIVQFGLEVLKRTRRPGLQALMELAKVEPGNVSAKDVGFKIIPRLNAPGRVDHAQPALDLLLAKDLPRAREMAKALEGYNKLRQSMGRKVFQEAAAQVVGDTPIIFAFDMSWPAGVVGLAANQLAKKYNRPALVVGGNGRHAVGSGRSPKGYNILELLEPHKETFLAMGGHAQAAGFSLEPDLLPAVQKSFWEADVAMPTDAGEPMVVDAVLSQQLISWDMAEMLKKFEPFGEGNPQPKFIFKDMPVVNARTVGKESQHAKMMFEVDGKPVDGIGFSLGEVLPTLGAYADVVATPAVTHYMGRSRLELSIEDMAPAGKVPILAA